MNADRDVLSIPDSAAWRAGTLYECERIIKVLRTMKEELIVDPGMFTSCELRGALGVLEKVARALEGAG
jgi:hypothetical protein